jgi:hypothetical protein
VEELNLEIWLQPKQRESFDLLEYSPFTKVGHGGAKGGGKSRLGRDWQIQRRFKYAGTNGTIIRRLYKDLYRNHIEPLLFREKKFMRSWYNSETKQVRFPNGSVLNFAYAEHEEDVESLFQGPDHGDICVEEAGQFTQKELETISSACRWTGTPDFHPKMLFTFNPRGRSHFYLKRVFVDGTKNPQVYKPTENPKDFAFVQAYAWDNIEWSRQALNSQGVSDETYYSDWSDAQRKAFFLAESDYGRMMAGMQDEDLRSAWLEGSWEQFEGLVFPELKEEVHNLDNFDYNVDYKQSRFIAGIDYGGSGTTACIETVIDLAENCLCIGEHYKKHQLISAHAEAIKELLGSCAGVSHKHHAPNLCGQDYILLDPNTAPDDKQLAAQGIFSVQDEYNRNGINTIVTHRFPISVGINLIKEYLKVDPLHRHPFTNQMRSPRLFISKKRMPNLWREMKELQKEHDEETGKLEYIGQDHAIDPLRYILLSRPSAPKRAEIDLSKMPTTDAFAIRTHDRWGKQWDKKTVTNGNGKGSWF